MCVPASTAVEVHRGRHGADPRNGDPPADVVVGLPVDDLLEGGQPAGHALGHRPYASSPAGRTPR